MLESLKTYLDALLQQNVTIEKLPSLALHGLPIYLSQAYAPYRTNLFGRTLFLAESLRPEPVTPRRLLRDLGMLRTALGTDVALVLREVSPWQRQRYIAQGLPFIVPGRQLYLPMLLVDLREHFPRAVPSGTAHLRWPSQAILLRQLLFHDLEGQSLHQLANRMGYSGMTLTHVKSELTSLKLCEEFRDGRTRRLRFPLSDHALWEKSRPYLRSPIQGIYQVVESVEEQPLSGLNALALQTMLQEDGKKCVAIHARQLRSLIKAGELNEALDESEALTTVEAWHYDPQLLTQSETVDPLSLFLSLEDNPNERVQLTLAEMMESRKW